MERVRAPTARRPGAMSDRLPACHEPRDEPSRIRSFAVSVADKLSIKEDDLVPGRGRPVDPETGWKPNRTLLRVIGFPISRATVRLGKQEPFAKG